MSRRLGEYVPLSISYADDDAILGASPLAELLFVRGLALAGQLSSDGYLTEAQVVYRAGRKLGSEKKVRALAAELVERGVWERQDGGYDIRAWLKWNKSSEELGRERAKDRDRKRSERGGTEPGQGPDSAGSPPPVQPDTSRTPDGIQPDADGNPDGVQGESGGSPDSRAPARRGARRAVVAASGKGTALNGTERHDTLPGAPDKPETPDARANRLARIYTDQVPLSNFPAIAKIVRKAVDHCDDETIITGLKKLVAENRGVTTEQLRVAIYGAPKNGDRPGGPKKTNYTDEEYNGGWNPN